VMIHSGIQLVLMSLHQQSDRLQRWTDLWSTPFGCVGCHETHADFHEKWYMHSGNIKVITSKIWEAAMLVLLIWWIHGVSWWDSRKWHDICTKFHDDLFRGSGNIKVITSTIWEAAVLVLLNGGIYEVHYWDGLSCHDKHTKFYND
jgi:hypothetical protein